MADSEVRECDGMYMEYHELIKRKYDAGKIEYERYCFLMDKLTQWYYVACEREGG